MKNIIFALVGPSGSGKSTLINGAVRALNENLAIIKSVTTRDKKSVEDELFYDFITIDDFLREEQNDSFVELIEYAGNYYGYLRTDVDAVLSEKNGICAATEHGVIALMRSGYHVKAIKIIPKSQPETRNTKRKKADKERSKLHITCQKEIINSFAPGGKEKVAEELINYIKGFVR